MARIAILTRGDLFPARHGAAVKIVRTAEALVARGDHVFVVTEDRDAYLEVRADGWARRPFGARARAMWEWPVLRDQARARRWCARIGYPEDEHFLYAPMFDAAWWARAVYVGVRERIEVYQPEFPGYAVPSLLAARVLGGRVSLGTHNVEFDRLRQMTDLTPGAIARVRALEVAVLRAVDDVVAVSEPDRARLVAAGVPASSVRVVPHGVDTAAYAAPALDLRARYDLPDGPVLFFHGTLHYAPNAEAIRFLAATLVPSLRTGSVLIAGMSPPEHLRSERLRFTGPVDDLPAHILGADLCLCPILAGGGTRMKLLEYFAAGRATVSTALGAEGLEVRDGVEIALAEPDTFVARVHALLGDAAARARMGHAARAYAAARDWSEVGAAWQRIHRGEGVDFTPRPSVERHLPPRTPSKPLTMLLLVNRGCNLRCRFCDLWDRPERLPRERVPGLLDDAVAIGTKTLVITGGEPTLHPDLPWIVSEARRRGLATNLTTNGTLLDRHYAPLVAAGLDSLSISIDGLPETHDRLRGREGAHRLAWEQLRRVVADRRVGVNVYMTVTRENVRELVPVWEAVRELGAGFDFWPVNDAPDLALVSEDDARAWRHAVGHIARHDEGVRGRAHYYAEALRYHAGERTPMRCLGLVDQYGVTYTGALLPCCVWGGDGLEVGNVFDTSLRELWTSAPVQAARRRMFDHGCEAGCYNHSLYEFTVSTGLTHRVVAPAALT